MSRIIIITASVFGLLAVAIGAFGAHALKNILSPEMKIIFETGNKYHFYHSLALLLVGILHKAMEIGTSSKFKFAYLKWSAIFFIIGLLIFPGTLYLLALTNIKILGAITPIGGVSFIVGWIFLIVSQWKKN